MMVGENRSAHRIRSLRWKVGAGSAAEAFSLRTLLHDRVMELLLPVLDQGMDEAASGERVIHIPRIELRVRLNSGEELETILPGKILGQLKEELRRHQADNGTTVHSPAGDHAAADRSRFDILLRYLQTGTLPWHATGITASGQAADSDQAAALSRTCRDQWRQILEHLTAVREGAALYFRLLQLLPEEEYAVLIQALSGVIPQEFRVATLEQLTLLLETERDGLRRSHYTRLNLMAALLAESGGRRDHYGPLSLLKVTVDDTTDDTTANGLNHPAPFPNEDVRQAVYPGIGYQTCSGPSAGQSTELFPMLVQQAGLLLLHPYIVRYFDSCGVLEAGSRELHEEDLPRAAALLHFLATGREELYEYELGLIKTLLGLHPETPLPVCAGLLTPDEREEAELLLRSAIDHWSVLKSTSIDAFRSSFIERQGVLREEESGWRVNVERKGFDVLLDQIPWSFSIVKLPWMKKAIFTEW
jgi:hypothetical protein